MIDWKKIAFWFAPFLVFLTVIGIAGMFSPHPDQVTAQAVRRPDATYATLIAAKYPIMLNSITVEKVTIPESNWVIVTLKNTSGDELRALLYDPLEGAQGIVIVVAPSKTYSPLDIAHDPGVSIPQTVSEGLLP